MPRQDIDDIRLPLEKRLRADAEGTERDALVQRIDAFATEIKKQMDSGVSPEEFARLSTLHEGLAGALRVVGKVWQRAHPA